MAASRAHNMVKVLQLARLFERKKQKTTVRTVVAEL